jgi:hypothetical protein
MNLVILFKSDGCWHLRFVLSEYTGRICGFVKGKDSIISRGFEHNICIQHGAQLEDIFVEGIIDISHPSNSTGASRRSLERRL